MSEISSSLVFDGVSLALHAAFPDAQIHGGEVRQGLNPGDFNVILPGGTQKQEIGRRYKRSPIVDVVYYPKEGRAECLDMADALMAVLEDITTPEGDQLHAASCDWTVTDDVLHVLTAYEHFVYVPTEEDQMETLRIEQRG